MSIRDEMDNFFEDNKAFAIFQVCEANDLIVTNLSFTPVYIRFGYAFTGFGEDALYFHIANITSVLGKHVAPPFSLTHVDFDNTAAAPKLTLALGKVGVTYPANCGSEVCAELIKKFRRSVCHSPQLSVGSLTHRQ